MRSALPRWRRIRYAIRVLHPQSAAAKEQPAVPLRECRGGGWACKRAPVAKLLPKALDVHREAIDALEPLLQVYEGCARAYLGEVEGANLIKLHRHSGKVSYLVYPDFATHPHPALLRGIKLSLRTRELDCFDCAKSTNPPILHRKESFLPPGHQLVAKFARLTRQEENHGLLDETATIGTREGWERRLAERGFQIRGHRLVRRRGAKGEEVEPRN